MTEHSYSGLYYPFIHFKDDSWLKLAALYWDQMARIAPTTYRREDSDTVKALGNFVQNLPPDWVSPSFGGRFVDFVEGYGSKLQEHYSLDRRDQWGPVPPTRRPPPAGGGSGTDPRLSYVFYEKMSSDVQTLLRDSKLAMPDPTDPRWIGMHPKLADLYMTALADQLAGDRGLYPVTDEAMDHLATGGWTIERLAQALLNDVDLVETDPSSQEVETLAAYVAIESVLPTNIEALPVDKILEFRDKYPGERAAFQRYVHAFVKPKEWLSDVKDAQSLERILASQYEKELRPKLAELRDKYQGVGIDTAVSVMTIQVGVPGLVTQGAAWAGIVANPIGALVAGAALALIKVLRDRRKLERDLKTSDVAYLMRIEKDLRPRAVVDWLWKGASRFRLTKRSD